MKKQVKSIFIANLSEISLNLVKFMSPEDVLAEISEDHNLCDRFLFSIPDNSILITPRPLEANFFKDTQRLLGLVNVVNLVPSATDKSICEAILDDANLFEQVVKTIKTNPGMEIRSYAGTPQFFELVKKIKDLGLSFSTPEMPTPECEWTVDFFGSKQGFRQVGLEQHQGAICANKLELIGWAMFFLKTRGGCVLKTNNGLAGAGLKIVRHEQELMTEIKSQKYWSHFPLVVEEFIEPDMNVCGGAPNIELRIKDSHVQALYPCAMRVSPEGVFQGVELGVGAVPSDVSEFVTKTGLELGDKIVSFGYNGYFEIDFVAGTDGKIYPIECNTRRTGGTHVFELGQRLLDKDFLEHYYLIANNRILVDKFKNLDYLEIKDALKHVLFPRQGKKEGVIISVVNSLRNGRLGYVIVGDSKEQASACEQELLAKL